MQDRGHGVKGPVQDDELGASLVRTLEVEVGEGGGGADTAAVIRRLMESMCEAGSRCLDSHRRSHLSHGGVVGLVGVQLVLDQLGQGGVILVLADTPTDGQMDRLAGGVCWSNTQHSRVCSQRGEEERKTDAVGEEHRAGSTGAAVSIV